MKTYLMAAAATAALIATPAMARDGQPYIGIEGGVMFPKDQDADVFVDYTTTQTPATTPSYVGPADTTYSDMFGIDYKRGLDIDAIVGYDFGMFRLEGELGYKKASIDQFEIDNTDLAALNAALNRPSGAGDPGAPGLPALSATDVESGGSIKIKSAMVNGLLDFGDEDGLSFYAGVGAGRAWASGLGEKDSAWAYQGIAGVRYALSRNVDLGVKYRYFQTGRLDLSEAPLAVVRGVARGHGGGVVLRSPCNDEVGGEILTGASFTMLFARHARSAQPRGS